MAHGELMRDYGPGALEFWRTCATLEPVTFTIAWITAGIAITLTCTTSTLHEAQLRASSVTMRRQYYLRISAMARVFAITCALSLLTPRAWLLWHLLQKQYEAYVLASFGQLLFLLLSLAAMGSAQEVHGDAEMAGQRIVAVLASQGAQRHFAQPPLCCVLHACMSPGYLSVSHLLWLVTGLRQFVFAMPSLAVLVLWAAIVLEPAQTQRVAMFASILSKLSTLLALYCLFVLYRATHEVLHAWHTTAKFVSIKLFLLVALVQEPIVGAIVGHGDGEGQCLRGTNRANFWAMWLLSVETIGMAVLLRRAFPAEELEAEAAHERSGVLVELQLRSYFEGLEQKRARGEKLDDDDL